MGRPGGGSLGCRLCRLLIGVVVWMFSLVSCFWLWKETWGEGVDGGCQRWRRGELCRLRIVYLLRSAVVTLFGGCRVELLVHIESGGTSGTIVVIVLVIAHWLGRAS